MPALLDCCRTLAVQMPANFGSPSQQLIVELAKEAPWRDHLVGLQFGENVLPASDYIAIMKAAGATVDLWETTYHQQLTGADPVLDWLRGTTLLRVHAALGGADSEATLEFERQTRHSLASGLPSRR